MRVVGLDGRTYPWNLSGASPLGSESRPRSRHHLRARALLARLFPLDQRLEEVGLPGSGGLRADFVLPARRAVVEVHGEQHYGRSSLFHDTPLDFLRGQARDRRKAEWCGLNRLTLIELPHDESDDEWARRVLRG